MFIYPITRLLIDDVDMGGNTITRLFIDNVDMEGNTITRLFIDDVDMEGNTITRLCIGKCVMGFRCTRSSRVWLLYETVRYKFKSKGP